MPPMELGDASVAGTMEGSFLAPDMHMAWEAPAAAASGSVDLSRDANSFTCRAPALDISGALLLKPAPIDAVKTVLTQVRLAECAYKSSFAAWLVDADIIAKTWLGTWQVIAVCHGRLNSYEDSGNI